VPHKPHYVAETLIPRARVLRADATPAERELWELVRSGRCGARFRRQQPVGTFIVDFYCASATLVIELDGAGHAERQAYDAARTAWLEGKGLTVLRFPNADVLQRPQLVHAVILKALHTLTPARRATPLPRGERGR
jgi:very-short-patch-repair endonuclease